MIRYLYFSFIFFFSWLATTYGQSCQLNPPTGLYIDNITSCGATLHWKSSGSGIQFAVSYKLKTASVWPVPVSIGSDTFYRFTGLLANTKYELTVLARCPGNSSNMRRKIAVTTALCSLPDQVTVSALNHHAAKITVTSSCSFDSLYVKFQTQNGLPQVISFVPSDSYTVPDLNSDSTYLFQVSTCPPVLNNWSNQYTVYLKSPPNILLILTDDSRFDYYSCNGAPAFFQTPNIDRIADEGVNFKRTFAVTSLCAPSRASIATGLFTLKTGLVENGMLLDTNFMTVPKVLQQNGYYTALVGKNHGVFLNGKQAEFNYYLSSGDGKQFNYNGKLKKINKEYLRTVTDTTIALLKRIDQPMLLWFAPTIPHLPAIPLKTFDGRSSDNVIPWLPDTAKYTVNYPSFIYKDFKDLLHGYDLDTTYRSVLEVIAGLDSCIGEILKAIDSTGKMDNTLIIFMTDNGFNLGNHWLSGKTQAYESSMRLPLFIRYPKWFAAHSIITDQFALNIDIASTIYEAVGVNGPPTDGMSLKSLYDGTVSRKSFYYLMPHNNVDHQPSIRAIRDEYFKYIHYTCYADTVVDFFDEVNDPLELTNLANNSAYHTVKSIYKAKYDSIRIAWHDTVVGPLKYCYIEDPYILKQLLENNETLPVEPVIYPTLTSGPIEIFIPWVSAESSLYNSEGQLISEWDISESYSTFSLPGLSDGLYFIKFSNGKQSVVKRLILQRR